MYRENSKATVKIKKPKEIGQKRQDVLQHTQVDDDQVFSRQAATVLTATINALDRQSV